MDSSDETQLPPLGEDAPGGEKTMAEQMVEFADGLDRLREMAVGFRAKLLSDGYSPPVAEQVSAHLMISMISRGATS